MKPPIAFAATAITGIFLLFAAHAAAAPLITDDEARRPDDTTVVPSRAITRGPTIRFEEHPADPGAHTPFEFRIRVEPHGGASIDPAGIRVIYLKVPAVDLTDRLRPYITAQGIDMPAAEAPAGQHPLRIEVRDSDGHVSQTVIRLEVAPPPP
jgi:hypothetical protein